MASVQAIELDPQSDFAAVYEAHYQAVYRAVRSVLLDPDLTEDVVQDAFLRAYRNRGRYRPEGRLQQWLCTIAIREAFARLRRLSFQRRLLGLVGRRSQEPGPPPVLGDMVEEAMATLTSKTRAVVVLHYHHGYRYREIAEMLGIPEGTVGSRLSEGLRRMRRHLQGNRTLRMI